MTGTVTPDVVPQPCISVDLDELALDVQRIKYKLDPVSWVWDVLGEFAWSKQKEILLSIANNRQTAVPTCHSSGKSWTAAVATGHWIDVHPPMSAFVVTSAPTGRQVRSILWREINRVHRKGNLAGRTNMTEWLLESPDGKEELVAFGQKPADFDASAFQGIHQQYVLVIFDEAGGMEGLWEQADSLISNKGGKFLAIGNPDDPLSHFADICSPGSGWNVIQISAFDTPNFTGEPIPGYLSDSLVSPIWQELKLEKWGENNPFYISKVLGKFPESSKDSLIPLKWIRDAQDRDLSDEIDKDSIRELGVDVGAGGDESVICKRVGYQCRIVREDHEPNTITTLGHVIVALRDTKSKIAKIDKTGIGTGMCNQALLNFKAGKLDLPGSYNVKTQRYDNPTIGIMVGGGALDKEMFINLRAQGFWGLRTLFQDGLIDIDPNDDDLAAQLLSIKYKPTATGKIQISPKSPSAKVAVNNELEVIKSPGRADALMLCCLTQWKKKKRMGKRSRHR